MILKLLAKYSDPGLKPEDFSLRVIWGPVLPQDMARQVNNEVSLVQSGIHSRRRAMDEIGIQDPEYEFNRWLEERGTILKMNKELSAKSTRGGARERALQSQEEGVEE